MYYFDFFLSLFAFQSLGNLGSWEIYGEIYETCEIYKICEINKIYEI